MGPRLARDAPRVLVKTGGSGGRQGVPVGLVVAGAKAAREAGTRPSRVRRIP